METASFILAVLIYMPTETFVLFLTSIARSSTSLCFDLIRLGKKLDLLCEGKRANQMRTKGSLQDVSFLSCRCSWGKKLCENPAPKTLKKCKFHLLLKSVGEAAAGAEGAGGIFLWGDWREWKHRRLTFGVPLMSPKKPHFDSKGSSSNKTFDGP